MTVLQALFLAQLRAGDFKPGMAPDAADAAVDSDWAALKRELGSGVRLGDLMWRYRNEQFEQKITRGDWYGAAFQRFRMAEQVFTEGRNEEAYRLILEAFCLDRIASPTGALPSSWLGILAEAAWGVERAYLAQLFGQTASIYGLRNPASAWAEIQLGLAAQA